MARAGAARVQMRLLGAAQVTEPGQSRPLPISSQPKRLALLAFVACQQPVPACRRDTLLSVFWPEEDAVHGRNSLRQMLFHIRRDIGALAGKGAEWVRLDEGAVRCDVREFLHAAREERLEDALALYQGELLPGLHLSGAPAFELWLESARDRLRRTAHGVARELVGRARSAGDLASAVERSWRATEIAPYHEPTWRTHIGLLAALGDRAGALTAYRSFVRRLSRDLGLVPSPETADIAARIRTGR